MNNYKKKRAVSRILERDGDKCFYCDEAMSFDVEQKDPCRATLDHIIAKSQGGSNQIDNLVLACFRCNQTKDNKSAFDFIQILQSDSLEWGDAP